MRHEKLICRNCYMLRFAFLLPKQAKGERKAGAGRDVVVSVWQSTSVISAPRKISPLHPLVDPKGDGDSNFGWCGKVKLRGAETQNPRAESKRFGGLRNKAGPESAGDRFCCQHSSSVTDRQYHPPISRDCSAEQCCCLLQCCCWPAAC
jgi:hypothetical protein